MAYSIRQQMLTLSYIAYAGYRLIGTDRHNALKIRPMIENDLAEELPTKGEWRLVWGPAVDEVLISLFDDNLAYIVQNINKPNQFAVVFRGTNPISITDWVFEDFLVVLRFPWRVGRKAYPRGAKISHSSHLALRKVTNVVAPAGLPGAGTTIQEFLAIQVQTQPEPLEIFVTGHSLGGAISPTFGLLLRQTQGVNGIPINQQWDPEGSADIKVVSFAGPTAGNSTFAEYSDSLLPPDKMDRLANSKDIVPHAWNQSSLAQLYDLYEPIAPAGFLFTGVITAARLASLFGDYTQVNAAQPYLEGTTDPRYPDYFQQIIFQHVVAYPDLLGLHGVLDPYKYFPILNKVLGPPGLFVEDPDTAKPAGDASAAA